MSSVEPAYSSPPWAATPTTVFARELGARICRYSLIVFIPGSRRNLWGGITISKYSRSVMLSDYEGEAGLVPRSVEERSE